jgi:PAS domain S-box-containing protein
MENKNQWIYENNVPVVVVDQIGIVNSINPMFKKTFFWESKDLVGCPVSTIIPANLRDAHNMGFSRYIVSKESTVMEMPLDLEILTGKGQIQLAQHFIVSFKKSDTIFIAAKILPL